MRLLKYIKLHSLLYPLYMILCDLFYDLYLDECLHITHLVNVNVRMKKSESRIETDEEI